MKKFISLFLFITIFCTSCSYFKGSAHQNLISRLDGKGIVLLSPDNPYIAANLLIAQEIYDSQELEGFINHKGIPNLIEINDNIFENLKYNFFYPKDGSYYSLEKVDNVWVINGPRQITEMQNKQIFYITSGQLYDPKILPKEELPEMYKKKNPEDNLTNSNENIGQANIADMQDFTFNDDINQSKLNLKSNSSKKNDKKRNVPPTNKKTNNKVTISKSKTNNKNKKAQVASINKKNTQSTSNQDPMLDMIIDSNSTYTSELNFRGDLIHYVTYKGEDLSLISRWYTKDAGNKDAIARINSIKKGGKIEIGDKIVIPAYLVKNKNKLTQGALRELTNQYKATDTWNNPPEALPQKSNNNYDKDLEFF